MNTDLLILVELHFIISMRTKSSITEKKLAEIYGYFFDKWNKYYRGRHNGPNSACPNYVSFKG